MVSQKLFRKGFIINIHQDKVKKIIFILLKHTYNILNKVQKQ